MRCSRPAGGETARRRFWCGMVAVSQPGRATVFRGCADGQASVWSTDGEEGAEGGSGPAGGHKEHRERACSDAMDGLEVSAQL